MWQYMYCNNSSIPAGAVPCHTLAPGHTCFAQLGPSPALPPAPPLSTQSTPTSHLLMAKPSASRTIGMPTTCSQGAGTGRASCQFWPAKLILAANHSLHTTCSWGWPYGALPSPVLPDAPRRLRSVARRRQQQLQRQAATCQPASWPSPALPCPGLAPCAQSPATAGSPCAQRRRHRAPQCATTWTRPAQAGA